MWSPQRPTQLQEVHECEWMKKITYTFMFDMSYMLLCQKPLSMLLFKPSNNNLHVKSIFLQCVCVRVCIMLFSALRKDHIIVQIYFLFFNMLINVFEYNWFTLFYVYYFVHLKTLFLEMRSIASLDYQRGLSHKQWIKISESRL